MRDYTLAKDPPRVRLIVIEAIMETGDYSEGDLEGALDTLRGFGTAGIVRDVIINESYNEAVDILYARTISGSV